MPFGFESKLSFLFILLVIYFLILPFIFTKKSMQILVAYQYWRKKRRTKWIIFFYIEVQVFNSGVDCKNHFGMDEPFSSFQCQFDGLNEITPSHDYLDVLCKIYHKRFCGGISRCGFHTRILLYWFQAGMVLVSYKTYFKHFCCGIFFGDSTLELWWANSKPKFVLALDKLKSLTSSPRSCPSSLINILLFGWSLPKSNQPKI